MRQVNVHEAKTELSRLLEEVEHGERVVIARAGVPVAVLVPYKAAVRKRRLGQFAGQAKMHADFDELPQDIAETLGRAVKLLVDTQVLLWSATDARRLPPTVRAALEDGANDVAVSVVSAWEIAIKQSLGKLDLPSPAEEWLPEVLTRTGFEVAELGLEAALRVRGLAWHHRDPFDRLIIAHAMQDGYTVVTHDEAFASYGVALLRA